MSETVVFTRARRQLVMNAMQDMLYLLKKNNVHFNPRMGERIRTGWDAIKLPEMPSISFNEHNGTAGGSGIALPFSETTRVKPFSQVEEFAAAADMKKWKAGG